MLLACKQEEGEDPGSRILPLSIRMEITDFSVLCFCFFFYFYFWTRLRLGLGLIFRA